MLPGGGGWRADCSATHTCQALACFEEDFEACIAHLRLPVTHRRFVRTTDLLERLFVEERFTEFELRQTAAVRKDLDHEYQVSTTPLAQSAPRF